ncbi:hypothetical protein H0H92_012663, partial [Tricholoma furcatifolium]
MPERQLGSLKAGSMWPFNLSPNQEEEEEDKDEEEEEDEMDEDIVMCEDEHTSHDVNQSAKMSMHEEEDKDRLQQTPAETTHEDQSMWEAESTCEKGIMHEDEE